MNLKSDNKPTESGYYWAGNFNKLKARLEIDKVFYNSKSGDVTTKNLWRWIYTQ